MPERALCAGLRLAQIDRYVRSESHLGGAHVDKRAGRVPETPECRTQACVRSLLVAVEPQASRDEDALQRTLVQRDEGEYALCAEGKADGSLTEPEMKSLQKTQRRGRVHDPLLVAGVH
jgi:hypothetical protein